MMRPMLSHTGIDTHDMGGTVRLYYWHRQMRACISGCLSFVLINFQVLTCDTDAAQHLPVPRVRAGSSSGADNGRGSGCNFSARCNAAAHRLLPPHLP